jgi:hypothetical protein
MIVSLGRAVLRPLVTEALRFFGQLKVMLFVDLLASRRLAAPQDETVLKIILKLHEIAGCELVLVDQLLGEPSSFETRLPLFSSNTRIPRRATQEQRALGKHNSQICLSPPPHSQLQELRANGMTMLLVEDGTAK